MQPSKVGEYRGWEIYRASETSFSTRKAGQRVGPYASLEEARAAIDAEEGRAPEDQRPAR